jgi:oligopeptide/dipeptide ABC transporter ATP-binding protein
MAVDDCPIFVVEGLRVEAMSDGRPLNLVDDFNISLSKGEVVGLVGETGAGKSLSMRAGVGLLPPAIRAASGSVYFGGRSCSAGEPRALRSHLGRGICLLLQNGRSALNPFMRVHAQIDRILSYRGHAQRDRRSAIDALLESVGLPSQEIRTRYPHELSGGQAQRVAMTIALASEPLVLIADEPTTALDVTTERDVIQLLLSLCRQRNMSLILITHNLGLVANNCDRVAIMHAGHIVEIGPTASIFEAPQHPYTLSLLQAIPDVDEPRELTPLAGSSPGPSAFGLGCRFAMRCPHVDTDCKVRVPDLAAVGDRLVRCVMPMRNKGGAGPGVPCEHPAKWPAQSALP